MTTKTRPSRLTKALLEMADDMRRVGLMNEATHGKITLRHLDKPTSAPEPISGEEIRKYGSRRVSARLCSPSAST